ncbi:MAG TPA: hypothetical protein PLJ38_02745, partial [bacterium]|nr:hypothetical protein [bacterium]
ILPNSIYEEYHNRSEQISIILAKEAKNVYLIKIDNSNKIEAVLFTFPFNRLLELNIIKTQIDDKVNLLIIPDINCDIYQKSEHYSKLLETIIQHYNIDVVINSSFDFFSIPESVLNKIYYFYDISEDYLEIEDQPVNKAFISHFIETELYKADYNITSSKTLSYTYRQKYWTDFIYLPNTIDVEYAEEPEYLYIKDKLFANYKIENYNTKILSVLDLPLYGRNLDLILKAFINVKKRLDFPVKLIISTQTNIIAKYYNDKDIIFENIVSDEQLRELFIITNVGAVPLAHCKYTDHSLPVALIEYGLFHKIVISTPTEELQHHHLPHIIYASPEQQKWEDAIVWAFSENWKNLWDTSINFYKTSSFITVMNRLLMKGK